MDVLSKIIFDTDDGDIYYHIINNKRKEWLFKNNDLKIAFEIYQPTAFKGKLLKKVFPYVHRNQLVQKKLGITKRSIRLHEAIKDYLDSIFEEPYNISYFGGTPCVHQKAVLQISRGKNILAYCKITESKEVGNLFDIECENLQYLYNNGINNIPKVLGRKDIEEYKFFCQSSVKSVNATTCEMLNENHIKFLKNMYECTKQQCKFTETDYYATLCELEQNSSVLLESDSLFINQVIKRITSKFEKNEVDFGFYHGDFTPWNIVIGEKGIFVFDFEYAKKTYPPYLDIFHFFLQTEIFVHKMYDVDIILKDFQKYKDIFENITGDIELYFELYLLEIINLYLSRGKDEAEEKNMKLRLDILRRLEKNVC